MLTDRFPDLARLLKEQSNAVSLIQMRALGITLAMVLAQVRALRWQQVHPGIYAAYTGPLSFQTRCAAALLHAGEGAALDDETALILHGWRGDADEAPIRVVVGHARRVKKVKGVVVRRSRSLTWRSVQTRKGLAVVRVERALCAMGLRARKRAHFILASGVQQGLATAAMLRGCLLAMGPIAGRPLLMRTVSDLEGGSRSGLEIEFIRVVRRSGLPLPERNHPLTVNGRRLWLDACYAELRIAIEIDGRLYHLLAEDWDDDLVRQNDIVLDDWRVLRFTARAIRETPDTVVEKLRAAIALAERQAS